MKARFVMAEGWSAESRDVRKRINYLSYHNAIPEEMTVYNALTFYEHAGRKR